MEDAESPYFVNEDDRAEYRQEGLSVANEPWKSLIAHMKTISKEAFEDTHRLAPGVLDKHGWKPIRMYIHERYGKRQVSIAVCCLSFCVMVS